MKTLKRFFSAALVFFLIAVQLFAATPKQIAMAGDFYLDYGHRQIFGSRTIDKLEAAGEGQGGVLFRAIAVPGDKTLLNQPISLKYHYTADNDGSRLRITFGNRTIIENDLYDWMLLPVAAFADTPYYNCVTLLAKPVEREEIYRSIFAAWLRKEREEETYAYFAAYHAALADTLVGLNLFLVDAVLVKTLINPDIRKVPAENMGVIKGYNNKAGFDEVISSRNFQSIRSSIYGNFASYIFSDPGESISFKIENNRIKFGDTAAPAAPYYHFLNEKPGTPQGSNQYEPNNALTDYIRKSGLVRDLSPAIFDTAEKTAQWAAFFRYVKINAPDAWYDFIMQIKDKITESRYIPGKGPEDGRYQYTFDSDDYHWGTPRMLELPGNNRNEEFKSFVAAQESRRSTNMQRTLSSKQQETYSSLNPWEQYIYLSVLGTSDREKCDALGPGSRSVFLNLNPVGIEMNTYLSLTQPQREVCDVLDGGTRRRDFLFLPQRERNAYMTFTPEQREIWYKYDEAKRSKFLSLAAVERHRFILDDKPEIDRLRAANQYEKLASLAQKQQEIYFSIAVPHERDAYLSLTREQREFCDSLGMTDRYEFLSISPRERDRFILDTKGG